MFEADGKGSKTTLANAIIEKNTGAMAYQIFRITDGAEGTLRNSTIRSNNPVEVRTTITSDLVFFTGISPTHLLLLH
jgi:hypothetical protein